MFIMIEKIRIGILGCAAIAEKYSINAFKSISNVELVCIASRDHNKAKEWAAKHNIQAEKSYDAVLQRDDIDAVYIPLPVGLHEEWTVKTAKAGKNVLCEKSLTDNLKSAKNMIETCKSQGVVLYENFMCGYHPQHAKVIELIHKRTLGEPFVFQGYFGFPPIDKNNFRYNKDLGGGSLNDAGTYTVFMARKMLESEPIAVTSKLLVDSETNVDIQGSAYLEFPNERAAFSAFGFNQVYQNNYIIWGTKGLVRVLRAYGIPPNAEPIVEVLQNDGTKDFISQLKIEPADHFALIFQDFCDILLNKDKEKIARTYDSILAQAKVMEALRVSARENRKVEIKEV